MNRLIKPAQVALVLTVLVTLSACSLGQAGSPTATPVDINAVMTSAAATAYVQLTQIAGQASATIAPSKTPVPTSTSSGPSATSAAGLQLVTATEGAGGLPAQTTQVPGAGSPTPGAASPSLTPLVPLVPPGTASASTCFSSQWAGDVTIPDGTVMAPYQKFTKIWAVKNTGTCAWDQGFGITIWTGPAMDGSPVFFSGNDKPIQPGSTVDMAVEMRAPPKPGEYIAHWTMIDDNGKTFGGDLTVYIKVK